MQQDVPTSNPSRPKPFFRRKRRPTSTNKKREDTAPKEMASTAERQTSNDQENLPAASLNEQQPQKRHWNRWRRKSKPQSIAATEESISTKAKSIPEESVIDVKDLEVALLAPSSSTGVSQPQSHRRRKRPPKSSSSSVKPGEVQTAPSSGAVLVTVEEVVATSVVKDHELSESIARKIAKRKRKNERRRARANQEHDTDSSLPKDATEKSVDEGILTAVDQNERQLISQGRQRPKTAGKKNFRQRRRGAAFSPWIDRESANEALEKNSSIFKKGVIRINRKRRRHAYITVEGMKKDLFVYGVRDRNRALDGDTVVVEIVGEAKPRDLDKYGNGADAIRKMKMEQPLAAMSKVNEIDKNAELDDAAEETAVSPAIIDETGAEEDDMDGDEVYQVAKVVAIAERRSGRIFSGFLMHPLWQPGMDKDKAEALMENGNDQSTFDQKETSDKLFAEKKVVFFKPCDMACPIMMVSRNKCPADFGSNYTKYRDQMFVARFERWAETCQYPFGLVLKALGDVGDIRVETEAILETNCVRTDPFSPTIISSLPTENWSIPSEEIQKRKDLREERIFTIDPETARDLDDAVSVQPLPNGNLTVGVHIADVSFFVKPNTPLDREAQQRATTTYMVQRAYPMLPNVLCEHLCSLNPGVERLAFSVIWTMTPDANIIDTWFGRTVIRSCIKMNYGQAQFLIDGCSWEKVVNETQSAHTHIHTKESIIEDVKTLHRLSRIMRKRRFDGGALTINQPRLKFSLDEEGLPTECSPYEIKESNQLIEEFMLLANISVAKHISNHHPAYSLLRSHPPPRDKALDEFTDYLARMGFPDIDTTSSGTIQQSIAAVKDDQLRQILTLLAVKPMQRARYFCTGDYEEAQWRHYALNFDCYTHFTSPIRRYADVVVHRLLQSCLVPDEETPVASAAILSGGRGKNKPRDPIEFNKSLVTTIAKQCNLKKEDARQAQDESLKLYLCVYLRDLEQKSGQPNIDVAIVMDIGEKTFDVYLPRFALDRRVFCQDAGCARAEVDPKRTQLKLSWSDQDEQFENYTKPPYGSSSKDLPSPLDEGELPNGQGKFTVWRKEPYGSVHTIRILQQVMVRLVVVGRSPMDVKAYLLHPSHFPVHFPVQAETLKENVSEQATTFIEEVFAESDY